MSSVGNKRHFPQVEKSHCRKETIPICNIHVNKKENLVKIVQWKYLQG